MKATIEWHDTRKELPKENGTYLVSHFYSFHDYMDEYRDNEETSLYYFIVDQQVWESCDPNIGIPINALIPQGDSTECILSWAELPKPYDPMDEVSE